MPFILTNTSPVQSFTEPVTVAEMKYYLTLPERDPLEDQEDSEILRFISAVRVVAEHEYGCELVRKQWDFYSPGFCCEPIKLKEPLVSVDLVRYRDSAGNYTTLAEGTGYVVDTASAAVMSPYNVSWPSFTAWPTQEAVLIRFTAGYSSTDVFWSDAGQSIKHAIILAVSGAFNHRLPFDPGGRSEEYYRSAVINSFRRGGVIHVR